MNELRINLDALVDPHPIKIVIQEKGKTLIDMPSDEFVGWLKAQLGMGPLSSAFAPKTKEEFVAWLRSEPSLEQFASRFENKSEENNEGDRPCEDGDRPSDSLPAAGA